MPTCVRVRNSGNLLSRRPSPRGLEGEWPGAALNGDPLELCELVYGRTAPEPSPPAVLDAPERHLGLVVDRLIVDMHDPGLQLLGQAETPVRIAGEDPCGETVARVVCPAHRF